LDAVVANVPAETLNLTAGIGGWGEIAGYVIMYLATFAVGQEAVSRYYAARDGKAAVQGSIMAAIVNSIFAFVPVILGITMLALFNMGKLDATVVEALSNNTRYALPTLAIATMPAIVVGILFSGIVSATMSSADSDLLGAGSIFANDIYRIFLKKDATSKQVMTVTKITMVVIGVFSCVTAILADNIITLLAFSFTLRAAGTFFPYVLGHFWKKSSPAGCVASLIVGSIAFYCLDKNYINIPNINDIIPALVVSLIVFVVFSLIFPPKEETLELTPEAD
ncbi:MAG: sodium:solute symporter family protein, partial [Oscillospiraceae bacterium]